MCRNITELRGLEPPATNEEIAAAARQYVRKVSGITHPSSANAEAFEAAVAAVAAATTRLLGARSRRRRPGCAQHGGGPPAGPAPTRRRLPRGCVDWRGDDEGPDDASRYGAGT